MIKILIYDTQKNLIEKYYRNENDPMPYSYERTLLISEFKRRSTSQIIWSTKQAIEAWNYTRKTLNLPIYIGGAFKRIYENGHANMSQHYAGVAFDCGHNLLYAGRVRLINIAVSSNLWTYVEPIYLTTTYVHFDKRYGTPACIKGGYPLIRYGSKGVYVMILQDALNTLGYNSGNIDGIFGENTLAALKKYQSNNNLVSDGICGCLSWTQITAQSNGMGRTSTTKD